MLNCTTNVTVAARATATYNYESSMARQSWGSQHRGGTVVRSSRHVFYGPGEPDNARWDAGFWGGGPFHQSYNQSKRWRRYHGKALRQAAKKAGRCRGV
jgi:hypothetical protein